MQVKYQLAYRIFKPFYAYRHQQSGNKKPASVARLNFQKSIASFSSLEGDNVFQFLNIPQQFGDKIEWNFAKNGKLWTYNLNYFEFLSQENMTNVRGLNLIHDFISQEHLIKDGMESFPISLRTIFWIKFLSKHAIDDLKINESLYRQVRRLSLCPEYHLMGNHLLENGFALLFGGCYFQDVQLIHQAKQILQEQLDEQILSDGAHFELSPMYHQIMLYRVLDSINLLQNNPRTDLNELQSQLSAKASLMLGWLQNMTMSNGTIPMLNDSTSGIAPASAELHTYANQLGITAKNIDLSTSGYRKIKDGNYEMIVDVGQIGPDYIPGHAHSDTFNFVLHYKGIPIIIDTGISTYEKNALRNYQRSTAAHNTVRLNGLEQSEIWGAFRVARRAAVTRLKESDHRITATHNGYKKINAKHQRSFISKDGAILIVDKTTDANSAEAFFHFHPETTVRITDQEIHGDFGKIVFDNLLNIRLEPIEIAVGFNKTRSAQRAVISFQDSLQTQIIGQ